MATVVAESLPVTPEKKLIEWTKSFVPRLREAQAASDLQAKVPDDLAEELHDAGAFSLMTPAAYGGMQASLLTWMDVVSEMGRGNGGVAWAATLINACAWSVAALYPRHVCDEVFSTPRARVAGVFAPREIKARKAPGGIFIEKGLWIFNSGVNLAQWDLLGVPRFNANGELVSRGIALLPMSDVKILHDWDTMGLRGSGSSSVAVENVFVPDERIADLPDALEGKNTGAFMHLPIYRTAFMPVTAIVLTFPLLGLGQHMMEKIIEQARGRVVKFTRYADQLENPVLHLTLGEASAKLEAAQAMVAKGCSLIQQWADQGEVMPFSERARVRLITGSADQYLWDAVDMLGSAAGGAMARRASLLNRLWADAKVCTMHAVVQTKTNCESFGRVLCGLATSELQG